MKILIVEDDTMPRKVLARLLTSWDYEVIPTQNGKQAWEVFQTTPADIVISDWMMPELDGIQLCRKIRSAEHLPHMQASPYTYFILLTSRTDKESLVEALSAGADDFITKPFDEGELKWRIHSGERILELSRKLAQELNRVDEHIKNINVQMTLDVQRLLNLLEDWKKVEHSELNGNGEQIKKQVSSEVMEVVFDWVSSLKTVPDA